MHYLLCTQHHICILLICLCRLIRGSHHICVVHQEASPRRLKPFVPCPYWRTERPRKWPSLLDFRKRKAHFWIWPLTLSGICWCTHMIQIFNCIILLRSCIDDVYNNYVTCFCAIIIIAMWTCLLHAYMHVYILQICSS